MYQQIRRALLYSISNTDSLCSTPYQGISKVHIATNEYCINLVMNNLQTDGKFYKHLFSPSGNYLKYALCAILITL